MKKTARAGRPRSYDTVAAVRLTRDLLGRVDDWAAEVSAEQGTAVGRGEAIRRLIVRGLGPARTKNERGRKTR